MQLVPLIQRSQKSLKTFLKKKQSIQKKNEMTDKMKEISLENENLEKRPED